MREIDVSVILSTTKHAITGSSDTWIKLDVPVCSTVSRIDKPLKKLKKQELKQECRELAEHVHIDIEEKILYVGILPIQKDIYLVKYHMDIEDHELEEVFLKRWKETKMLFFEFSLYDKKDKYLFSLKGLWNGSDNQWESLRIEKHRSIMVTTRNKTETIISKGQELD